MLNFRKNVCLCGPLTSSKGPLTGVALAFELLIKGLEEHGVNHRVVNSASGNVFLKPGTFSVTRAFESLLVIFTVLFRLSTSQIYYSTMSTSVFGFVRDYFTVYFAHILRCRIILHLHGGGFSDFYQNSNTILQSLICSNLKRVDHIIVLGELLKDQFYCAGDFIKQKLVVVPNGLTIGINEPQGIPKVLPKNDPIKLLYLSSLMPSKGFFNVIQAMKILDSKYPNRYNLNICGSFVTTSTESSIEVHDKDSLLNYINNQNLGSTVRYYDQVNSQEKEWHFKNAHIFLLPTSYAWEGQPLSIIEAMAFSTPVISCYHKGIPELIQSNKSGLFVKPHSVSSIVEGVTKIISNKSGFKEMSVEARKRYEKYFKREVHVNRMIEVICHKEKV